MAHRADDFDDDDYLPREDERASVSRLPYILIGGAVLGALVLGGLIFSMRSQSHRAA